MPTDNGVFRAPQEPCRFCGIIHDRLCPYVKSLEFAADGVTVTRVEFLTPLDYPRAHGLDEPESDYPKLPPAQLKQG